MAKLSEAEQERIGLDYYGSIRWAGYGEWGDLHPDFKKRIIELAVGLYELWVGNDHCRLAQQVTQWQDEAIEAAEQLLQTQPDYHEVARGYGGAIGAYDEMLDLLEGGGGG